MVENSLPLSTFYYLKSNKKYTHMKQRPFHAKIPQTKEKNYPILELVYQSKSES